MIAAIIWDRAAGKLILSRDSSGIKPLFYHVSAERVAVGSEIKALFADEATPRAIDWETSLAATSLHGTPLLTPDRAHAWFTGVHMVRAGTTVEIDLTTGDVTTHQDWHPRTVVPDSTTSAAEFVERYKTALTRSVRENREADAEVGLLLSGGIDSVSIAALTEPGMATFTVLCGSTAANGDAGFAHEAAVRLGHHNHQVLVPDAHTPSLEAWLRFLCLMETPLASMEAYLKYLAYIGAKTVNPSLRGMMIGSGADEFAGGYAGELAQGDGWDGFVQATASLVRATARSAGLGAFHWTDRADILDLVSPDAMTAPGMSDPYAVFVDRKFLDVEQYNTWIEDRAASGSSVEGRAPFLDRELVELAVSVPAHLRRELLWDKNMLRAATRGIVPERLRTREKQPFFHGAHANHAFDIAIRMLKANNYEMVRTACADAKTVPFTVDSAVRFIERVERRPSHSAIDYLLRLVNLALLDQLASGCALGRFDAGVALPADVEIVTYDKLSERHRRSLLSPLELDLDAVRYSLNEECEAVAPIGDTAIIYIARNGEFDIVIDENVAAWRVLLPVLDAPQARHTLAARTGLADEVIHRLLGEGVSAGFLTAARA
jgi:asparagine synthase (glutamine-hydrolysing)